MTPIARSIAVDRGPGQIRAVALDAAGRLIDLAIERPGGPTRLGDLHRGRVTARVPALAGAFVSLGDIDGFLPDSAGGHRVQDGTILSVRVVRAGQGGKGPRLEAVETACGSGPPALLARGPGAIATLAALHPDATVTESFAEPVAEQVEALAETVVTLPRGGRMSVTPTPALVAIDLDLAAGTAGQTGKNRAHEDANAAWIPEIARQIRLRNLGGAILIDFAGLSARRRGALGERLAQALVTDPAQPKLLGFTGLGFAEIVRPRAHPPLHEILHGPHAVSIAAARSLVRESLSAPARRLVLRASPAVIAALARDQSLQHDVRSALGEPARTRVDPTLPELHWVLEAA